VKTRRGNALGAPEEAVTAAKRRKLIATAQTYLMEHGAEKRPFHIDVLAVQLTPAGRLVEIRHYRGWWRWKTRKTEADRSE
jgi:putative endonuclease